MLSESEILDALKTVQDPEIALNIVEMGLIYDVKITGKKVHVKMTLTNSSCPFQSHLAESAEQAVAKVAGLENTVIEMVWEPKWTPERMEPEARKKMGL